MRFVPTPLPTCTVAWACILHMPRRNRSQTSLSIGFRWWKTSYCIISSHIKIWVLSLWAQSIPPFLLPPLKPCLSPEHIPHATLSDLMGDADPWRVLFDSKEFSGWGARCEGVRGWGLSYTPSIHILYLFDAFSFSNQSPREWGFWFSLVLTEEGDGRIPLSGCIGYFWKTPARHRDGQYNLPCVGGYQHSLQ